MNRSILAGIQSPDDVKKLSASEIELLSAEIRKKIIEVVGTNGGHLSSNLGVVELTIALHRVFSSPDDTFIWDVGHQSYTHKLLTGRFRPFSPPYARKTVFPVFRNARKASMMLLIPVIHRHRFRRLTGFLSAKRLSGLSGKVIAIIGDGALSGGMAIEALSHAGQG